MRKIIFYRIPSEWCASWLRGEKKRLTSGITLYIAENYIFAFTH